MPIPDGWLLGPADLAAVEADLALREMPDLWLRQWRALLDRMAPGDELWTYSGWVDHPAEPEPEPAAEPIAGFEQVRDARALGRLGLAGPATRRFESCDGFALVRAGLVLDWIEETD